MHLLLSLKLYSSTFFVIPVNLDGSCRIKVNYYSTDSQCTEDSLLDQYANRIQYQQQFPDGQLMTLNFLDFTRKYKVVSGRITKHTDNTVLRVFPHTQATQKGTPFHFIASTSFYDTNHGKKHRVMHGKIKMKQMHYYCQME